MVWACIANGRKGPIIRLEAKPSTSTKKIQKGGGGINAEIYANQVILGPLKDFWMELKKEQGKEVFVVEDGAPAHKGKIAQAARKAVGICRLSHPPNSPDLNPIEPIWRLLKKRVYGRIGGESNIEKVWGIVQEEWGLITVDEVKKHTGRMNARVLAVKKAYGYHTEF
jgi:hypothetical protein